MSASEPPSRDPAPVDNGSGADPVASGKSPIGPDWVVGRGAELAVIERLLADARAGRSGALLIAGDPGIGKTTLLDTARSLADGFTCLNVRADALADELERVAARDRRRLGFAAASAAMERAGLLTLSSDLAAQRVAAAAEDAFMAGDVARTRALVGRVLERAGPRAGPRPCAVHDRDARAVCRLCARVGRPPGYGVRLARRTVVGARFERAGGGTVSPQRSSWPLRTAPTGSMPMAESRRTPSSGCSRTLAGGRRWCLAGNRKPAESSLPRFGPSAYLGAACARARGLTSQETRVALLVAEGKSNKEVAAALFLSPKTIEHHLGSVFRKRGFRSRSELAVAFARLPGAATEGRA